MTFSKIWNSLHGFSSTAWHVDTNTAFHRLKTIIIPAISHQFPSDQPVQSVVPSKAVSDTSTFIRIFFTSPTLPWTKVRPIGRMEARGFPHDASAEHLCLLREFITSTTLFLNKLVPDWSSKASFWLVHVMFCVTWNWTALRSCRNTHWFYVFCVVLTTNIYYLTQCYLIGSHM